MVTLANLTAAGDGNDQTSYATASVAPAANRLVLIAVHGFISAASTPPTPTVTGNSITYALVRTQDVDPTGGDRAAMWVFRGMSAAPTSGPISIDFGTLMEGAAWSVDQSSDDVDTSGVNGSGAIVQTDGATTDGTSLTVPFPAAMTAGNAGYAAFAHQATEPANLRPGWTELGDASASFTSIETQYRDGTDTAGSGSWTSDSSAGGIVVEIRAGSVTPGLIEPIGIPSTEAFGSPAVSGGAVTLPGHISDPGTGLPVEPEAMAHHPAFVDGNGALYKVMESEPGINPVMMKSTDGGGTWAEAGVASHPTDMDDVEGAWSAQAGMTIWVAQTPDGDGDVHLKPYFTSDHPTTPDSWGATETVDTDSGAGSGPAQWVSMCFLSTGDAWLFYQNAAYRKRNSDGSYGARVATSVGQYPMPVVGAGDVTHLFVTTATEVQYRTLTAAGVLSGTTRVDTTGHYGGSTVYSNTSNAAWYDAAGVDTACALYTEADGSLWLALVEDGTLSREQVTATAIGVDQGASTGGGPDCHLAVDGTTLHAVYTEDVSGDLNYRTRTVDGVWSAETTLRAGGGTTFAFYPYNSVLTKPSGKVMAVTYDVAPHVNGQSFTEYDQVELALALVIEPTSIASAEAFGSPTLTVGAVDVIPTGIPSAEAFGTPAVDVGSVAITPAGIPSSEAFGTPVVSSGGTIIAPTGIPSGEAFGTGSVVVGGVVISPTGVTSLEAFGTATVTGGEVGELVDISFTVGPTRVGTASVAATRQSLAVDDTRASTVTVDGTRHGTLAVASSRNGTASVDSTRAGSADVGDTRQGLTVGPTRRDRGG